MYNVIHDTHVADYNMKREKFKSRADTCTKILHPLGYTIYIVITTIY